MTDRDGLTEEQYRAWVRKRIPEIAAHLSAKLPPDWQLDGIYFEWSPVSQGLAQWQQPDWQHFAPAADGQSLAAGDGGTGGQSLARGEVPGTGEGPARDEGST